MNNAQLYILVTRLEQAERACQVANHARRRSSFLERWQRIRARLVGWRQPFAPAIFVTVDAENSTRPEA